LTAMAGAPSGRDLDDRMLRVAIHSLEKYLSLAMACDA
jgi:hypothetical protein